MTEEYFNLSQLTDKYCSNLMIREDSLMHSIAYFDKWISRKTKKFQSKGRAVTHKPLMTEVTNLKCSVDSNDYTRFIVNPLELSPEELRSLFTPILTQVNMVLEIYLPVTYITRNVTQEPHDISKYLTVEPLVVSDMTRTCRVLLLNYEASFLDEELGDYTGDTLIVPNSELVEMEDGTWTMIDDSPYRFVPITNYTRLLKDGMKFKPRT